MTIKSRVSKKVLAPGARFPYILSRTKALPVRTARSSSGLGRRPLKAEITSSNLVRATNDFSRLLREPFFHVARSFPTHEEAPCAGASGRNCRYSTIYVSSLQQTLLLDARIVGKRGVVRTVYFEGTGQIIE